MAGSTAEINWTSNDAQVMRTFQKVERGFDDIARRMDRVEKAADRTTRATVGGFDKIAGAVKNTAMALIGGGSLMTAIDMIRDANRKMMEEAAEAARIQDDLFRGFRVQAGLNALEAEKAKQSIIGVARANAVATDVATAGAKGLVSAGFAPEDASGNALNVLLRTQAAMNASGKPVDAQNLAKQAAAYFTSQGMESNTANLQKAMENAFALRAGAFELSDFAELGKQGAVFRGRLTQQEQLAAFGTLVDAMPSAEAGTALRNVVSRLSTASVTRTGTDALDRLGLKPTDVDLVGENFGSALDRLAGGLQKLPEEERDDVLRLLFEEAGVASASILINERGGKYTRYQQGMAKSAAEFQQAAAVAQRGRNAAAARFGVSAQATQAQRDAADDLVLAAIQAEQQARGIEIGQALSGSDWYPLSYPWLRSMGMSQEAAIGMQYFSQKGDSSDFPLAVLRRVEAAAGGAKELDAPRFTTAASIEAREARERELAELEAEWYRRRDARIRAEAERGSEMGRGFRRSGVGLRQFGQSIRMENWFGPSESDLDALKRAMQENTEAVKENSRTSGSGQQRALPSAALRR